MKKQHFIFDKNQIQKITKFFIKNIFKKTINKNALVIGLKGNLGAGKTTFVQALAKELGIKNKILSPTFVIMRRFQVSDFRFQHFYHFDCYRIKKLKEILDLEFKKIISNPKNIVIIEWADKIKKILPKNTILIKFSFIDEKTRKVIISKKGVRLPSTKWKIKNV